MTSRGSRSRTPRKARSRAASALQQVSAQHDSDDQKRLTQRVASKLAATRTEVRFLKREVELLGNQNNFLLHLDEYEPKPLKIKAAAKRKKGAKPTCIAGALASDWHMEERVDGPTVNHLNEYSPEIAQERASYFFKNFHLLMDIQRAGANIDEAILWLGGDFISGYIHPEFEEDNYLSPIQAAELVFDTLTGGIDYLLAKADLAKLMIPCSIGNHGRTTEKRRVATAAKNSYEWGLYHRLRKHYDALVEHGVLEKGRVKFLVGTSYHTWVEIGDVSLRFHHGDDIQYRGGIGGVTIPLHKAIHDWNTVPTPTSPIPRPATCDFLGHYHQYIPTSKFLMNGSLIGWNPYAISIHARYEEPQQAFFMVDPYTKHGQRVVGHFPIRVGPA